MSKTTGPDLKIIVPELDLCQRCKGYGTEKPLVHEMVCAGCGGAGFVDKATGAPLDPGIALVALNRRYRKLKLQAQELRRNLRDYVPDPYGPLPERCGGKSRGD